MATIPLHGKRGHGLVTHVDDADLALLAQYRFTLGRNGYARTYLREEGRARPRCMDLHLLLRDHQDRLYKDHINGDKLDNRRSNLRPATAQENAWNQRVSRNNTTGYKGVRRLGKRFQALIHKDGVQLCLSTYPTPELAAAAYNGAALALYGQFARLNDLSEVRHAAD